MKLDRAKYFVAFMTAAGLAVIAGLAVFLIVPALRDLADLSRKLIEAETEVQAQYANRRNLLSSIEKIQEIRLSMKDLASQFVPAGSELTFIESVEAVGERNAVEVRLRLVGEAAPGGEFRQGFEVSLNGAYENVFRAYAALESLPTLISIESFQIRGGDADAPDASTPIAVSLRGLIATPPQGL